MVPLSELKSNVFFQDFSDEEITKLADIAVEKSFRAGEQVYKKGEPADYFYILKDGKIVMTMDVNIGPQKPPLQVTVDFVSKGDAMGWSSVVEPYFYTLGARCIEDCKLIAFGAAELRKIINDDIKLGFKFMQATAKIIGSRLTHTQIILVGERGMSVLSQY